MALLARILKRSALARGLCCFTLVLAGPLACAHTTIEGTSIADTAETRAIVSVLQELKEAIEKRDANRLMKIVSPHYFEDMGTAAPSDDYGYHELQALAPKSMEVAKEIFLTMHLHDVQVEGSRAHADVRYSSRARLEMPSGKSLWDSHKEFNRIELERHADTGRWLIVSGL